MAEKKFFVDVNLQGNDINNLRGDTLDITANLASANTKRIVYYNGSYYYSDGTSWIALGGSGNLPTGGSIGDILAKASGTDYDVEWISNYTSTVQHEVKAGVALTKGQAVYVSSANGTNMIVSKASNASEATSSKTMGLAASSAALNGFIFVITEGLLTGTGGAPLNTSTANAGDPVWLGTNGNLIFGLANKPVAPAHLVFLGIVTRSSATVGEIFVKVQNGFELGELHDVDALNASNNDGLFYNTTTSLWEHKSIATALGYTPENVANKSTSTSLGTSDTLYPTQNAVKVYADSLLGDANALVYKGTIDCSTNPNYPAADAGYIYIASVAGKIGGASGTDIEVGDMIICNTDGTVSGNQATVGQYWNVIQKNIVGAVTGPASSVSDNVVFFDGTTGKIIKDSGLTLSGSNTGDETTATIKTKLGIASASADGYLTSTNWNIFNNKQAALSGTGFVKISGSTISYDNSTYLTANQSITLSGDITGTGSTSITTSLSASTVTGKLITGFVSGAGTVTATDSILSAIQKLNGNTAAKIDGSGTANYLSKFTAIGTIGNSLIRDDGTTLAVNGLPSVSAKFAIYNSAQQYSLDVRNSKSNGCIGIGIGVDGTASSSNNYGIATVVDGSLIANIGGSFTASGSSASVNIGGQFTALDGGANYAIQLEDGTEGIGKFLKSVTSSGSANWATLTVADTGLTLTTTGTNGAATLVGNTLNIPIYESPLIPKLQGNETYRGNTFRNNSTTVDTISGYVISVAGTAVARGITGSSFSVRSIRMGVTASVVATGRYQGLTGPGQQIILSSGFMFVAEFNISDTAFATGTHNFWGLAGTVGSLNIGDVGNAQPSALLNTIAFANDSGDANLQFMYNDGTGVATKIDLGASFPSNRTAGAAITTIYSCYIYNAPASTSVVYRIVNKETGAVAQGTVSSNLPATNVGLNLYAARTMGTTGGGVTNSGQFDVYRFGFYSL